MSQEIVEIAKKALAARNRGEIAGLLALMADDVVIDASRRIFDPVIVTGHDEAKQFAAMVDDIWADQQVEAEDWTDAGAAVVVSIRLTNTGRGSGVPVKARSAWVIHIREGKISRWVVYQSRAEALEAVGLSAQDARADSWSPA